jgi:diguanylate cyclase (GGDEF)-like protein
VAALKIVHEDSPHGFITLSCGVSTVLPGDELSVEKLVKSADNALYLAKKHGRNAIAYLNYGQGD